MLLKSWMNWALASAERLGSGCWARWERLARMCCTIAFSRAFTEFIYSWERLGSLPLRVGVTMIQSLRQPKAHALSVAKVRQLLQEAHGGVCSCVHAVGTSQTFYRTQYGKAENEIRNWSLFISPFAVPYICYIVDKTSKRLCLMMSLMHWTQHKSTVSHT